MGAQYRIIHYDTDPFSGARVPIGALVRTEHGVRLAQAKSALNRSALGTVAAVTVVQVTLRALAGASDLHLPSVAGPQVSLGSELRIPFDVPDAVSWVEEHVLTPRIIEEHPDRPRAEQRVARGMKFFKTWRVDRFVKKEFHLDEVYTEPVSHYVSGAKDLVLMEPVLGSRRQLVSDLRRINTVFLAWSKVLQNHRQAQSVSYVAYILPEGKDDTLKTAIDQLQESQARVINVDYGKTRSAFLDQIRSIGEMARPTEVAQA